VKWFRTRYRIVQKPKRNKYYYIQSRFFWWPFWSNIDYWSELEVAEEDLAKRLYIDNRPRILVIREIKDVNAFLVERKMGGQKL
jgi:hypothetical protein